MVLSAFSGDPDVFLSTTVHRPNKTHHWLSSEDHASTGDVISIDYTNPTLGACTRAAAACILYLSVRANGGPSHFSLTASAVDISDGFRIDAPANIAGEYSFTVPTFGPRLPRQPISACVAYAQPHDACAPLVNTPANPVAGCFAIIDRGSATSPSTTGTPECGYPDVYFANKIVRAQEAGAIGAIVVDDAPNPTLISMGAVALDQSAAVTIPSIFISQAHGELLKSTPGVRVSLQKPAGRLPMLVPGVPLRGVSATNQIQYYQLWTGPGHDALTVSLSPAFGDPDLFISADGLLPNMYSYTWSSRDRGADSITISAQCAARALEPRRPFPHAPLARSYPAAPLNHARRSRRTPCCPSARPRRGCLFFAQRPEGAPLVDLLRRRPLVVVVLLVHDHLLGLGDARHRARLGAARQPGG